MLKKMQSALTIQVGCILLGIVCHINQVCSQIHIQQNHLENPNQLEEDIRNVIDKIHSLSNAKKYKLSERSGIYPTPEPSNNPMSRSVLSVLDGVDLNAYYSVLSNVFALYKPLLSEKFTQNLPEMCVCILSGRKDCGLQAELTKAVSLEFGKPTLTLLSSVRSQTCTLLSGGSQDGQQSFLTSYLKIGGANVSDINSLQQMFITALSYLPLSGNLISSLSSIVDIAMTYVSKYIGTLLQTPLDFVKLGLQLGIKIPSLDESGQCQQGDLKQLLMWGMNHNISWSFSNAVLDMFLAPQLTLCNYPGSVCQNPTSFSRTINGNQDILLKCDRRNLALLNDTMCADVISMGTQQGSSTYLLAFCQALTTLSPAQLEQMWSNTCYALQTLVSPLLIRSSDCGLGSTQSSSETPLPPLIRRARASPSLNQLICNYGNWSEGVDAGLVALCGDNDRQEFVKKVCNSPELMKKLLIDKKNIWLWGYCANATTNADYLMSQFCRYDTWMIQSTASVEPAQLAFCWNLDGERLKVLVCNNMGLFTMLFSNPGNAALIPNCTDQPLIPDSYDYTLVEDSCQYSQWHDAMLVSIDVISLCIRLDPQGFYTKVCSNSSFLKEMLRNNANAWLAEHCAASLSSPPTEEPAFFNIADWCDYSDWLGKTVDPTVVGLCWLYDKSAFQQKVCCNISIFEKLTFDSQNTWLMSVCTDQETIDKLPQVCKYADWAVPVIVDMTELALCAELDPFNFTSKVCANATVLKNLLANLDNTWLLQHCANYSKNDAFSPAVQCQYSGWTVTLPDSALLALCWDYDHANFISAVCSSSRLLALLSSEASTVWAITLCATYTNSSKTKNNTAEPYPCLARDLVERFNWTCSVDFSAVCRAGASQMEALQVMLRCGVEVLQPRVGKMLTQNMAKVWEEMVTITVVMLVALEESQMILLPVAENIRLRVLESILLYFDSQSNFENKRILLQCFGRVLTSLTLDTGRIVTSDGFLLIKEYFRIPMENLRPVLSSIDASTVRQILQYYSRNKDMMQITDGYLSAMVSVLLQTQLVKNNDLFPELFPLITKASPAEIKGLPLLQTIINVRDSINRNLLAMSVEQRQAFGHWYSQLIGSLNISNPSVIRDTGNLTVYLPFHSFQHFSPAQLLDGLDVLQRNPMSFLQQQFVAHSIIGTYRNLTADQFTRLGNLSCLADPEELLVYKDLDASPVIQRNIMTCVRQGITLPSQMIVSMFLNITEFKSPTSVNASRLAELSVFLPSLGLSYLKALNESQLLPALRALAVLSFSPVQAGLIVDKLAPSMNLGSPGELQKLGSLMVGVKVETLLSLPAEILLSSMPVIALTTPGLSPSQASAIATKLWESPGVVNWLDKVEPLLSSTPLLSVLNLTRLLLTTNSTYARPWNTQQAQAIFKEVINNKPNFNKEDLLSLGKVGKGVSCDVLSKLFKKTPTLSALRGVLVFLRDQPSPLHTSLKKCVVEGLYQFEFFSETLGYIGPEIALALPVSIIKLFTEAMMDLLRNMIIQNPQHFFLLPRTKQELLVDKLVQRLGMYTGEFTEKEFFSLGIMATIVADEIFAQLDRGFFVDNLDYLQGLCYSSGKMELVARILEEAKAFGPVKSWTQVTLNQVGRFIFFLPKEKLQEIPLGIMTQGRIERLFLSQAKWEHSHLGVLCMQGRDPDEQKKVFDMQQFVLQYFLGFLKVGHLSSPAIIPTCKMLQEMAPSLWPTASLTGMTSQEFSNCLELISQDPFITPYMSTVMLKKAKEVYGPLPSFPPSVISQLGGLAVQLLLEELGSLRLTEISSISSMGSVSTWSSKQLAVLFSAMLNSTRLSPSQLNSSMLVAMGYIVCGAKTTDISSFNAVEFSKAVLVLGQLNLACTEEQLSSLVGLLTDRRAFGSASSWGTNVFIEIGSLAAGLPDMALSALVKEQIEGISPLAIKLIPPDKFAVVFSQRQIGMFSYEQAVSVTATQRSALSGVQLTALAMVLTPWENKPLDLRVRSLGLTLRPGHLCPLMGLLTLLIFLPCLV